MNYPTGCRWERRNKEVAETQRIEAEQRRQAEWERRTSEIRLPQLETRLSGSGLSFNVQHDLDHQRPTTNYISELDATPGHSSNRTQQPPTPLAPATEQNHRRMDNEPQASLSQQLQDQIQEQGCRIKELETELQRVKSETVGLRAQRDRYEKEHIQAILNNNKQEAKELRQQVDQLAECLNEAKSREQKLEADLDEAMSEKQELRSRLRRTEEEKSDLEYDLERLRTTTTRENRPEPATNDDAWKLLVTELLASDQGDNCGSHGDVKSSTENQAGREAPPNVNRSVTTSRRSGRLSAISVPRGYRRECGPVFM
ncbi:MAG: hypothetical protein L6R41_002676 [Letrouitia leprolyta]|nr:MAG: hypothetical protein L6R41_002676 [Letrouitia leprolyta]